MSETVRAGPVLGEADARAEIAAIIGMSDDVGDMLDEIMDIVAAAEQRGEQRGAEQEYETVYEQHCRKVDPDLEGYSTADLVGYLLAAYEEAAEQRGVEKEREQCGIAVAKVDAREWGQHYAVAGQALARATDEIMRRGSR